MGDAKILVFSASLRTGSHNAKLARLAARILAELGAKTTLLDLGRYPLPVYHGDIEKGQGVPQEAQALHAQFRAHDGVFIATPEYNSGLPPLLVNLLAWTSRVSDQGGQAAAFGSKVFAISAASPGALGGYRSLMALRQQLEIGLGARVLPAMVSVPAAQEAFDEDGDLKNERSRDLLRGLCQKLAEAASPR
jgi:chromate reductase